MRRPLLQLALDTQNLQSAVGAAMAARACVDIVEAGTVLILSEGLRAVEVLRRSFPDATLVADIRIGRAGAKFARMAFDAGADNVTVLGEAPADVIDETLAAAHERGCGVEVELAEAWTPEQVTRWVERGARNVIAHRFSHGPVQDDDYIQTTLQRLTSIDLGQTALTLAGGLNPHDFRYLPMGAVDVVAVGSGITTSDNPAAAAAAYRAALDEGAASPWAASM